MNKNISLIVAMTHDRVIGYKNKMPWHLPAELAYFKKITLGKTIVMGRKTYDSIGQALPRRRNIIISRQSLILPGCEIVDSLEKALNAASIHEEIMIIGGASLFEQTLGMANRLYLTLIDAKFKGDTFFPEWDKKLWRAVSDNYHPADEKNAYSFHTLVLERDR